MIGTVGAVVRASTGLNSLRCTIQRMQLDPAANSTDTHNRTRIWFVRNRIESKGYGVQCNWHCVLLKIYRISATTMNKIAACDSKLHEQLAWENEMLSNWIERIIVTRTLYSRIARRKTSNSICRSFVVSCDTHTLSHTCSIAQHTKRPDAIRFIVLFTGNFNGNHAMHAIFSRTVVVYSLLHNNNNNDDAETKVWKLVLNNDDRVQSKYVLRGDASFRITSLASVGIVGPSNRVLNS